MRKFVQTVEREKIQLIFNWCKKKFKTSKYFEGYPRFRVYKTRGLSTDKDGLRGKYENNQISIFLLSITSVRNLCETIIHEYKHYLLPDDYDKIYTKLIAKYKSDNKTYKNHPHEKICCKFEKKWGIICFNEFKKEFYNK